MSVKHLNFRGSRINSRFDRDKEAQSGLIRAWADGTVTFVSKQTFSISPERVHEQLEVKQNEIRNSSYNLIVMKLNDRMSTRDYHICKYYLLKLLDTCLSYSDCLSFLAHADTRLPSINRIVNANLSQIFGHVSQLKTTRSVNNS